MMKITFKDVSQGDSIILEWQDGDRNKIGIIDCRKNNGRNPVVQHLKTLKENLSEIEFIILSHPHYDHFSGMEELLDYCSEQKIQIKKFGHSFQTDQRYLDWANISENSTSKLEKLIKLITRMVDKGEIEDIGICVENVTWSLGKTETLKFIRPSDRELRLFTQAVDYWKKENNTKQASKAANLFSTIVQISVGDYYILLTSDATFETIERLIEKSYFEKLNANKIVLAQIPHHGSVKNHQIVFWELLKYRTNAPAVISSGLHEKYKHPDEVVVTDFEKSGYKVYATNHLYGMKTYLDKKAMRRSDKLNNTSSVHRDNGIEGDQVFLIKHGLAIYKS